MDSPKDRSSSRANSAVKSGARSVARSLSFTTEWLRRAIWVWPIIAAVILGLIGWLIRGKMEERMQAARESELRAVLGADVKALDYWMQNQMSTAVVAASNDDVIETSEQLVAMAKKTDFTPLELLQSPELKKLRAELAPTLKTHDYSGFVVVDRSLQVVAALRDELVGKPLALEDQATVKQRVFEGKSAVSAPRKSTVLMPDPKKEGKLTTGLPTMFAWAPIQDTKGEIVAALGLRMDPLKEFTAILDVAHLGNTGETYAFNAEGVLVSKSRFDEQLRDLGLLTEGADSILNIRLSNPGVDMTTGARPTLKRSEQPLNDMVTAAVRDKPQEVQVDLVGHRDYRGVPNIGAWVWLDDYQMGVATEQDIAESFAVLEFLRAIFWGLFGLLTAAALAIFVFTVLLARMNRAARMARLEARQLGQYTLDEKLGEGGMGVVYRAHHAMLRRPTAVKFLDAEKTNDQSVARFEREVQMTGMLTHPNTIAIYDYGRTPEGVFYYAMEYLEGVSLEQLVRDHGPVPEGRVIHILEQLCGSLAEAHSISLVHRDIKPANVILTVRGGVYDFVKLLDFGLVKALDGRKESQLTTMGSMAGTPLYVPPEAIERPEDVNAQSDLYSIGAVGYYLLTGTVVFDGRNVLEILQKHVALIPESPSRRLGKPVSKELEDLLLKCLAKDAAKRPASAQELAEALAKCPTAGTWTKRDAERWWAAHPIGPAKTLVAKPMPTGTQFEQTMVHVKDAGSRDTQS